MAILHTLSAHFLSAGAPAISPYIRREISLFQSRRQGNPYSHKRVCFKNQAAKLPPGVELPKEEPKLEAPFLGFTRTAETWNSRAGMIGIVMVFIVELGGDVRFCQKCSHHKPPRTHHCRICNRCVLRMDHHCVWINNCVGHANHKYLFVLVVYAEVACLYSLVLFFGSLTAGHGEDADHKLFFRIIYFISGLLLISLCLALVVLLCWNIYLVTLNKTQIEYFEGVRSLCVKKGGPVYSNPYDIGAQKNMRSILGPTVLDWICPTTKHIGTGLRFPTRYDDLLQPHTPK